MILPLLKNKYVLSFFIFFAWVAFFDTNNWVNRAEQMNTLHALEAEKLYYEQKISEDQRKLEELQSSDENLEKFAREQFLMKKPSEDIFVIED